MLAIAALAAVPQPAGAVGLRTPSVTTGAGSAVSAVKAIVNVVVNPLGLLTHYSVQYGAYTEFETAPHYVSSTAVTTLSGGRNAANFEVPLTGLTPSTVYDYRVVAKNLFGTTYGDDETFSTWPVQLEFLGHGVISRNNQITRPRGHKPKGWVMVIHGGGWQSVGREAVAGEDSTVHFVTSQGWAADNVDYRKGEHSLPDVLAAYDALRKKAGASTPICLIGHSAGGNLALLVAEHRKSVSCVISAAGPTNLVDLASERAYTPSTPQPDSASPAWTFEEFVVTSFGVARNVLREWSPVLRAGALSAHLLLGASSEDEVVPQVQMAELRNAMKSDDASGSIRTVLLAGANTPTGHAPNFTHASVTRKALRAWQQDERQMLARAAASSG